MTRIEAAIGAITEDRRTTYLFHTKTAAAAVGCVPNKFGDWWNRTRSKLVELYLVQPGELAAEMAILIAAAEDLRRQHEEHATSTYSATPTARPPRP